MGFSGSLNKKDNLTVLLDAAKQSTAQRKAYLTRIVADFIPHEQSLAEIVTGYYEDEDFDLDHQTKDIDAGMQTIKEYDQKQALQFRQDRTHYGFMMDWGGW